MNILLQYAKVNLLIDQIRAYQVNKSKSIEHKSDHKTFHNNKKSVNFGLKKLYCPKPVVPKFCCPDPDIPTLCCPPLKILHNSTTESCWIVSLLHNIRANKQFYDFILKNYQDEAIFSQFKKIMNLENREIFREEWEVLKTFYSSPCVWRKGGSSITLLEGILSYIHCKKNDDYNVFNQQCRIEYSHNKNNKDIIKLYKYHDIPYYTIFTGVYPINEYINVSNVFRGRPNNSQVNDKNIRDTVYFKNADDFIILNTKRCNLFGELPYRVPGITIQKDIYINVENKNQQQKYSLTGILLGEKNDKGIHHSRAFIKCHYQWYDTDYELLKSIGRSYDQKSFYDFFLDLKNQFKTETSIDYSGSLYLYVYAVFYQKVV